MSSLQELGYKLKAVDVDLTAQERMREAAKKNIFDYEDEVAGLKQRLEDAEKVILLLNSFADERQEHVQATLEGLVTHGLRAVFEEPWEFKLVPVKRGSHNAFDFIIQSEVNGETVETSVMDSRGGGVSAVVGFILRLVLLLLSGKPVVLFLDESFAQLSAEYEPRMSAFLRELVDKMHAQVIMVTHSDAYTDAADIVYRFKVVDGETKVERLDAGVSS